MEVEIVVAFVSTDLSPLLPKRLMAGHIRTVGIVVTHGITGLLVDRVAYRWQHSFIWPGAVLPMYIVCDPTVRGCVRVC